MSSVIHALRTRGYAADGARYAFGRHDQAVLPLVTRTGAQVVAKLYSSDAGQAAYANMLELWGSSFGQRRTPPGLPRPIEYLPDLRVLVMERVDGRNVAEIGDTSIDLLSEAIRLVACLHESDARPSKRRHFRGVIRSARRKAERVQELAPRFGDSVWSVAEALEAAAVPDLQLVPCHGDLSLRNVLVTSNGLRLIDWDRLQRADPARDIAYIGTSWWVWLLRQKRTPDWSVLEQAVSAYDSLRPGARIQARLPFHLAAGLLRHAHALVELWPEDAYLVPELTAEAHRRLQRS